MSKQTKIIIGVASFGIIAIIIGVVLYIFWPAIVGTINDNAYYTAEDLQQAYDKGFDDANFEKEELLNQIDGYTAIISEYELTIKEMTESIDSLESQLNKSNNNYQTALQAIEEYKAQVSSLQANISNLEEQVEELQFLNTVYSTQVDELQQNITTLNQTIATLNDQITYYEDLIESYDFVNKSIVTFKVDNKTYDVVVVENGQPFNYEIEDPTLLGYSFNGWTIDGVTPITLQGYEFTEDTTLTPFMTEENQVYYGQFLGESLYYTTLSTSVQVQVAEKDGGYSKIDIVGNNINSIVFYDYVVSDNDVVFSSIYESYGLTNLKDYAIIEGNKLKVEIPTSVINAIYPERDFTSDTFVKYEFELINSVLTLVDFFRCCYIRDDSMTYVYSTSEVSMSSILSPDFQSNQSFELVFKERGSDDIYLKAQIDFNNGEPNLAYTYINETMAFEYTEDCPIIVKSSSLGIYYLSLSLKSKVTGEMVKIYDGEFYINSNTSKMILFLFTAYTTTDIEVSAIENS